MRDADVVTEHLPDGTSRVISTGSGFELFTTSAGAVVFSYGETPNSIHLTAACNRPRRAGAALCCVSTARRLECVGLGSRHAPRQTRPFRVRNRTSRRCRATPVDLNTGAWFVTPELTVEVLAMRSEFSIREGLMATDDGFRPMLGRDGNGI